MKSKVALFFNGFIGFFVAFGFIAKALCTLQFWIRHRTFSSLSPYLSQVPQDDLPIANWMALEIAKRILLSVRQLPAIGGHFLCHLKTKTSCSIFGLPSRLACPRQPEYGDSCQKSDVKTPFPSSVEKQPCNPLKTNENRYKILVDKSLRKD
jgi:hypothetical protein